ncbi:hypothetical protein EVAR_95943_1 [Eumeta japonica]|uniref:Uncharacterized protein n=1 Tax=Eumeta variegata TaxID=151549 RepID=A0A4C1V816_EUMVA|nr:hypothetical protein EVAR_95943_1 [Eumeta japonica]
MRTRSKRARRGRPRNDGRLSDDKTRQPSGPAKYPPDKKYRNGPRRCRSRNNLALCKDFKASSSGYKAECRSSVRLKQIFQGTKTDPFSVHLFVQTNRGLDKVGKEKIKQKLSPFRAVLVYFNVENVITINSERRGTRLEMDVTNPRREKFHPGRDLMTKVDNRPSKAKPTAGEFGTGACAVAHLQSQAYKEAWDFLDNASFGNETVSSE